MSNQVPESVFIFGCGYLGAALARTLIAGGARVGALTRNPAAAQALRELGLAEVIEANLQSRDWHPRVHGDYGAVVNCVSSAGGGLEGYRSSYLEGQRSILEWLGGRGARRYVYTSSTSVYPQDGGIEVDEEADTAEAPATGRVLLESEALLAAARPEVFYIFRLAGIYGPGRHYLIDQVREGEGVIPGRGDYHLNMIRLEDIVSALLLALDPRRSAPSGIYNLADDCPAPKETVVGWLAERLGQPTPRFEPEQVSPRLARRGGRMPDRKILNRKAKEAFGWRPAYPSFREGYADLAAGSGRRSP